MKSRRFLPFISSIVATFACPMIAIQSASAASQIWSGATDATWATATNWVGLAVPGSTTALSGDIATFNSALNATIGGVGNPVVVDTGRRIGGLSFATGAGAYVIGSNTGDTLVLGTRGPGYNGGSSTVVAAGVTSSQVIASPITFVQPSSTNGQHGLVNNATDSNVTLSLTGPMTLAGSRPAVVVLDGTNTGNNTISGNISFTGTNQAAPVIVKRGTGTWALSGANTMTGTAATASNAGVQVLDGVLSLRSNLALGAAAQAYVGINTLSYTYNGSNTTGYTSVTGGTLEITNGITLDNGVTLNLLNGGTLRSSGSNTVNSFVKPSAVAGTTANLTTVSSGDVFSIGNAANDVTGGAADTLLRVTGPGTVALNSSSNYLGNWSVDTGTVRLGAAGAFGTKGSVNVASGARVQTLGFTTTLTSLTGGGEVSVGANLIGLLNLNIAESNTFSGQLKDGTTGVMDVAKIGAGTLDLTGSSTYTGATLLNAGTLNVSGSLADTQVTAATGTTLSGAGTLAGEVVVRSNARISPGNGGSASIGTLSVRALTLNEGSQLDFDISSTSSLDRVQVTGSGMLTIDGGQLNINGGGNEFTANGTYNLIAYSGSIGGAGLGSLTINGLNKSVAKTYTLGTSGGFITLTVANSGVQQIYWNLDANGTWGTSGNWTPATVPNAVGAFAGFGGGGTAITADRTITVNGTYTLGTLSFNGSANGRSYTLAAGTGAGITLNNGASTAFVTNASGNHAVNVPLTLTGQGGTFTVSNAADALSVGGVISGTDSALTKLGAGTLVLSGTNTYSGGTIINGGTLQISSAGALGDSAIPVTINGGRLRTTADIAISSPFRLGDLTSGFSVAAGTTAVIDGSIGEDVTQGTLNQSGGGTLVLNGVNSYTGGTVINSGTISVNGVSSLGAVAAPLAINSGTLQVRTGFASARNVTLGSADSTISIDAAQTYTLNGVVSGSGTLNKTGSGTLALGSNANSYTGGTVISAGTIAINNASFLGAGTLTFRGGTLQNNYAGNNTNAYTIANPIFVGEGETGTIVMGNRISIGSTANVTGSGTLNLVAGTTVSRDDLNNNWSGFTGIARFSGSGVVRMLNNGGTFNTGSFVNSTVDLGGTVLLQGITNSGGNTYNFGALTGSSATAGFAGGSAGRSTLSVGALNTDTTFAGQILGNNALTKVGTGTLTLTGVNTYTGNTTVSAGELTLANSGELAFVVAANGVVNKVTGAGTANIDGSFNFNLTAADLTNGNQWVVVDVSTINFGPTFRVAGFEDNDADDVWKKVDGTNVWSFDELTGVLSLASAPASPYAAWAASKGLTEANSGALQDPEFDGISNALEFVLGGDPLASDLSRLPVLTTTATDFIFTFSRADESEAEVGLVFQYGSSLTGWTDVPVGAASSGAVSVTENDAAADTIVITIPRSNAVGGKLFGRLKVVK